MQVFPPILLQKVLKYPYLDESSLTMRYFSYGVGRYGGEENNKTNYSDVCIVIVITSIKIVPNAYKTYTNFACFEIITWHFWCCDADW